MDGAMESEKPLVPCSACLKRNSREAKIHNGENDCALRGAIVAPEDSSVPVGWHAINRIHSALSR